MFIVELRETANGPVLMFTEHSYRPYAESQANVWRSMFPSFVLTIRNK